jgi:plastocyanin
MTTTIDRPDLKAEVPVRTSAGDRFVAVAALASALLLVGLQIVERVIIPPLAAFTVVYLVIALAIRRRSPRWLLGLAVVLPVLHLIMSVPFLARSLAHPESPGSFLTQGLFTIAALTMSAGALAAFRSPATGNRRSLAVGAGIVAVGAVVLSMAATASTTSAPRQAGDVSLTAARLTFPERIEVPAGAALWINNRDAFHHTFVIEGTQVHQNLPAGKAMRVVAELPAGSYRFFCDVPGHERMEGELLSRAEAAP